VYYSRIFQRLSRSDVDKSRLTYDPHMASQRLKYSESLQTTAQIHYEKQIEEEQLKQQRLEKLRAYRQAEMERLHKEEVRETPSILL
jgi:uncharacterized protein YtpQ (UPF0354 family)